MGGNSPIGANDGQVDNVNSFNHSNVEGFFVPRRVKEFSSLALLPQAFFIPVLWKTWLSHSKFLALPASIFNPMFLLVRHGRHLVLSIYHSNESSPQFVAISPGCVKSLKSLAYMSLKHQLYRFPIQARKALQ